MQAVVLNTLPVVPGTPRKIHLGCGHIKRTGFIGVDIVDLNEVDVVHDLSAFPYPFDTDSVDEVVMRNVLEHLPNTVCAMEEVWRICKNGARVEICVPYYNSHCASTDPTHMKYFTENTFDYFTMPGETKYSSYNYYTPARFRIIKIDPVQKSVLRILPKPLQWFIAHHFATVHCLEVVLAAVKK